MKKLIIPILLLSMTIFTSCEEETDPKAKIEADRHSACMIDINQYNTDRFTILTYTDSVYSKDGRYLGTIVHKDTLPTLGASTQTFETDEIIQNSDGEDVYKDTIVTKLDLYHLYINVSKNTQ